MGAYHNALREKGSREDLLWALEKEWERVESLRAQLAEAQQDIGDCLRHELRIGSVLGIEKTDIESIVEAISNLQRQLAEAQCLNETLKREAQIQAQEMRTQRSIVREIYQLITGKTGEPGDWNGAEPVRAFVRKVEELREAAEAMLEIENERLKNMGPYQHAPPCRCYGCDKLRTALAKSKDKPHA